MNYVFQRTVLIFAFTLTTLCAGGVFAVEIRVPSDYTTIRTALAMAHGGDSIKIAPGVYFESNLRMRSTISLIGAGDSATDVIIDGNNQGRILLCENSNNESIVRNLTFINGSASGEAVYDQSGGAILVSNCEPTIINCNFTGNYSTASGGAIRCTNASPQIIDCTFVNNSAGDGGGAIDCSYEASPLLSGCTFKNNTARWGGALSCRGKASPTVLETNFDRNISSGVEIGFGGAIFADFQSLPSFTKCTFFGNIAQYGGALACFDNSQTNLDYCTLLENQSAFAGGGMFCKDASPIIKNSIIAFHDGAAISTTGRAIPEISFTNIFGNLLGNWNESIADQAGGNNFSVDPLFCTYDPDCIFRFNLADNSPLGPLYVENGPLGAWPVGCLPLGNEINLNAVWGAQHPIITWSLDPNYSEIVFKLTRSIPMYNLAVTEIPFDVQQDNSFRAVDAEISSTEGWKYVYRLYALDQQDCWSLLGDVVLDSEIPTYLEMNIQAYPNPFNPNTSIHFEVAKTQHIVVSIYDIRGNRVALLEDKVMTPGPKNIPWYGRDNFGTKVSSGTYFVIVQGNDITRSKKIMLVK